MGNNIRALSARDVWDYENGFYWFSSPSRMNKLLAHYELYKTMVGLPGDVFELGVYKAASLIRFATFRNLLENDSSRKIVGFDSFGKFPRHGLTLDEDLSFIDDFEGAGGDALSRKEVESLLIDKNFRNVSLVEGNIFDTLQAYLEEFPATRISLLHLDMDVKEPTAFALDLLWDRVVPNGIVLFDDYSAVAGATEAIDEFLRNNDLEIQKLPNYYVPAFVRKCIR